MSSPAFAQKNAGNAFTLVAGRVLTSSDSVLVKEWFFEGLKAKSVQNFELAGDYFKRVIDTDPANDAALYELANLNLAQNRDSEAEQYARGAVIVNPANKWYWLLLAEVYKRTENAAQLNYVFDELIKIEPDEEDYYFDKANALLLQDKVNEAATVYRAIKEKFGASDDLTAQMQRVYLKQGKSGEMIAELEDQLKDNPDDIRSYLILSELYSADKNKDKALSLLQKAKKLDPSNPYIRLTLADMYGASGKQKEAFDELQAAFESPGLNIDQKVRIILSYFPQFDNSQAREKAEELSAVLIKVHPADPKAHAVYGDVLFQGNKLKDARQAYKQALQLNNQVYLIWEQLIRLEVGLALYSDAIAGGEEALTLFPAQAPLYLYTGIAFSQQRNHEKAIDYLNRAAELETEDKGILALIYSGLGDSYNAVKNYSKSNESYEKALEIDGNNSYVLNNYAYYLALRGESLEKAAKMSLRSNELNPDNAAFQDTYAWVLFKQKKYAEARLWMEKALKNDNSKSGVQAEHYGDILFFLGEKDLAVLQWQKAREYGVKSQLLERKINEKKYFE